ncbi:MAG: DUF4499 domain-containing protein [Acidimicrobiia bacterium]
MTRRDASPAGSVSPGEPRADSRTAGLPFEPVPFEPVPFEAVAPGWWIGLLGGMVVYGIVAFNPTATRWYRGHVRDTPAWLLRGGFALACGLHALEASYAYRRARELDARPAALWGAQTFLVGFPSLLALRRAARAR